MPPFEAKHTKQAVGFKYFGHVKLVCAFDQETFDEIRGRAVAQQISVAEQVRRLVEWGLEAERE